MKERIAYEFSDHGKLYSNSGVSFRHDNEPAAEVKRYDLEFMNRITFGF